MSTSNDTNLVGHGLDFSGVLDPENHLFRFIAVSKFVK
jgi:hypothetical protein